MAVPHNPKRGSSGLEIKVLDVQRLISLRREKPPLLERADLVTLGTPTRDHVQVLVSTESFQKIRTHVGTDLSREMGGFLVGRPYEWDGQIYVEIDGALPGRLTASNAVQLKITHDTWAEAQNEVRELFPGMHLVGWYHSHPHIGVFMSGSDVVIHQDIFNEPWHVALVLDPSRQEAQFYAWQKQQLTGVGGYQIAYPGELLPQGKWKLPEPLTARLRQGPRSLSQFYQVGCWHTRWAKPDDIIIRVQPGAVRTLQESAVQGSEWVVGILFGRLDVSSATWPRYYIDVIDALVSGVDGIANIEKAASAVTSILHKLFEIVRRGQTATVVGMFFCGNSTRIDPERLFRDVFTVLFNNPWDILIMGDTKHGPEYCLWADLGNNLIIRPLIEWVALAEITDNDQETILARVQSAMAGKDFLLQEE